MPQEDYVKRELQAKKELQWKQKERLIGSKDLEENRKHRWYSQFIFK